MDQAGSATTKKRKGLKTVEDMNGQDKGLEAAEHKSKKRKEKHKDHLESEPAVNQEDATPRKKGKKSKESQVSHKDQKEVQQAEQESKQKRDKHKRHKVSEPAAAGVGQEETTPKKKNGMDKGRAEVSPHKEESDEGKVKGKSSEKKDKEGKDKEKGKGQKAGKKSKERQEVKEEEVVEPKTKKPQAEAALQDSKAAKVLSGQRALSWKDDEGRTDLKKGKFSKDEDDTLRAAVDQYIQAHQLGEDGVQRLLATRKHKETLGAWLEIGRCLPQRSIKRVHARALRLLHTGNYLGKWSHEEEETLRNLHEQYGNKWALISKQLGRLPEACKDKWREIGLADKKQGSWSAAEKEVLCRLVRESLGVGERSEKAQELRLNGVPIRDDINWTAISLRMGSRTPNQCLKHWYNVLAPSMVSGGEWGMRDDRALLQGILESKASEEFSVDWDALLDYRSGSVCRKRWRMMVKQLQDRGGDFVDTLFRLCHMFAPDLVNGQEPPPKKELAPFGLEDKFANTANR